MSRQRSARSAALGLTVRRVPTTIPSRGAGQLRRRLVVGVLFLASLVLISISFRSDKSGPLSGVESAGATALRPFAVGLERVAQPFRDAYSWADSLLTAQDEAEKLREENRELRQRGIQAAFALQENKYLRAQLDYIDSPRFPADFDPVVAEVTGRPAGAFTQAIVIAAGSDDGVRLNDPVVTADGLVGVVTRVTPISRVSSSSPTRLPLRRRSTCARARPGSCAMPGEPARRSCSTASRKEDVVRVSDEGSSRGLAGGRIELALPEGDSDRESHGA